MTRYIANRPGEYVAYLEQRIGDYEENWIKKPFVDYVGTNSPDPRDAYTVRINGHVVGIHSQEQSAKNHAESLNRYIEGLE